MTPFGPSRGSFQPDYIAPGPKQDPQSGLSIQRATRCTSRFPNWRTGSTSQGLLLETFGTSNVGDVVGRGHVSRHVKPWTHISIPYIAKEALRPTSKTGTDRGDRRHVAVHK